MKKTILIVLLTTTILIAGMFFIFNIINSTYFDQPKEQSNKIESIEVGYVNWACDCANFYEIKLYAENPNYKLKADDCIFIEPRDKSLKIPKNFFDTIYKNKNLRLTGQFYLDKGISKNYELKTPEKPDYAKVFKYEKFEIVEKNH